MPADFDSRRARREREAERMEDWGFALAILGATALAFVVGRGTAPQQPDLACQQRLLARDGELILCEQRLLAQH